MLALSHWYTTFLRPCYFLFFLDLNGRTLPLSLNISTFHSFWYWWRLGNFTQSLRIIFKVFGHVLCLQNVNIFDFGVCPWCLNLKIKSGVFSWEEPFDGSNSNLDNLFHIEEFTTTFKLLSCSSYHYRYMVEHIKRDVKMFKVLMILILFCK